jgi:hypothetical protein
MEELIQEFDCGYKMLREAGEGLTEEELRFKPAPDQWSIHQILIHITDYAGSAHTGTPLSD